MKLQYLFTEAHYVAALTRSYTRVSMPGMLATMRRCFEKVADPQSRWNNIRHTLTNTMMSALAMFSLRYPSLLQFDSRARGDDTVRHDLRILRKRIASVTPPSGLPGTV